MPSIGWQGLVGGAIVSAELVGALSALITRGYTGFYNELVKPPFAPPGAVFPVVWAILYALMGIGAYLVYSSDRDDTLRHTALSVYAAQLAVNFAWSIIFFRFRLLPAAAVTAVLLAMLTAFMVWAFSRADRRAAALNIPYLLWAVFAACLAAAAAVLN
ncbi:MAG: tryptophan-rich sensory protein [Ruminococcus sp.]|nr:tryptophan-rich sensory protein [Ruminococcus sp.]